jgi:hypothetical protein
VQARRPEQETASREPAETSGLGWIDQLLPSQRSISGLGIPAGQGGGKVSVLELPTAKQTLGRGHEMPFSELKVAPGGLGDGTICQLVPFQRSTAVAERRGSLIPVRVTALPTAMHEFADEHATALRLVSSAPATFGVAGTVQAADATEGANSRATLATKTRRTGRSAISPTEATPLVNPGQAHSALSALDVSWRIAEDGDPPG